MTNTIHTTSLSGVLILESTIFADARGSFRELYREDFLQSLGIDIVFIQDNLSISPKGVLRGLHFQTQKPQAKLVSPLSGSIYDIVVDLRKDSPTLGKYEGHILDMTKSILIPRGFAHGFLTLEEDTQVFYKTDNIYDPNGESGIIWNDRYLDIDWQTLFKKYDIDHPILSEKDALLPSFLQYKNNPIF